MKKYKPIVSVVFAFMLLTLYVLKEDRIHEGIGVLKSTIKDYRDSIRLHSKDDSICYLPALQSPREVWFHKYHVIAHGGGGINGQLLTNSFESLNEHYDNGTRLFDVDINYTTDRALVLKHEWNDYLGQDSAVKFKSKKVYNSNLYYYYYYYYLPKEYAVNLDLFKKIMIHRKYHPMSVVDLLYWMRSHPEAIVLPDFKGDTFQAQLKDFVEIFNDYGERDMLSRVVVRIKDFNHYEKANNLFPYPDNIMLKKFCLQSNSYYDIISFCIKHHIHCIALTARASDSNIVEHFEKKGIKVFVAVVNDVNDYEYYRRLGAWGVVSDYLYENDIKN